MGTLGANRLTIACSNCGATLAVPATAAGRRIRCPKCDHRFVAQTPGPAPAETGTMSTGDARSNRVTVLCECGKRLKLPWAHAGKAARCPACRHALRVAGRAGSSLDVVATGRLVVRQAGQRDGEQVFLAGSEPVTVGKAPDNGLALPGTRLSRHHCSLTPFEGGWRIGDRGSTNGLFVNAKRVSSHDLEDGDQIQIGEFELTYRTVGSAAPGALAAAKSGVRQSETPDDATYRVADDFADLEALTTGERVAPVSVPGGTGPAYGALEGGSAEPGGGPTCPCCKRALPASGQVCVTCGINVKTGRSILTAEDTDVDETYVVAEGVIGWLSWILWTGVYPIASEAFGTRKPHVIRGVAVITILTSLVFLAYEWTGSPKMGSMKNLMLWAGDAKPSPEFLAVMYAVTNFGNSSAFDEHCEDIEARNPDMSKRDVILAAHEALPTEERCLGDFRASQLVTHAFLHGGLLHLAGNLLFLMVFGSRVNALIGNALTAVLYPLLAAGAAAFHMASVASDPPSPMLGASGAIMGLAGMYLVLFPLHKVHMAAWVRWGLITGFRLSLWMWAMRGFWVVLFYIAFDVFYTAIGVEDGTAHWAHLGGFIVGASLAMLMLLTRLVSARGGDIVSAVLGRYAWTIVGPPNQGPGILQRLP